MSASDEGGLDTARRGCCPFSQTHHLEYFSERVKNDSVPAQVNAAIYRLSQLCVLVRLAFLRCAFVKCVVVLCAYSLWPYKS